MNEKIKELWDATTLSNRGMDLWNDYTLSNHQRTMFNIEDFAKLIIHECIAQCNDGDSAHFIASHFGIEEPKN
jgi:hypothetical protein